MTTASVTAKSLDAVSCHICGLLISFEYIAKSSARCPRCDSPLHSRKANSLKRTWALLFAALIMYIPANIYPVLTLTNFGQPTPNTIIGGVVELAEAKEKLYELKGHG
uniref:paraquat-inducible protein A n=1 Tax=Sneathiella sp. TaxID=1964365 RepID=UPI0035649080